jgi:type II secretory pathway component PulJ
MNKPSGGFTLVEVLVASVILFSVLAAVSLVYRGAITASTKATQHLVLNAEVRGIVIQIEEALYKVSLTEKDETSLEGKVNGVSFNWHAEVVDYRSAPQKFNVDIGQFVTPPKKYKLWQVTLELKHGGLTKQYQFFQLGWNDV